ncbi:MAG: hypothetical protein MZV64_12900 [Ignavibacteriales bacterium]|nr:hypothetical protein [Ignavibacteriales bacterium]
MEKDIGRLEGHDIVCGADETAQTIIQELLATKRDFVVVDPDRVQARQARGRRAFPLRRRRPGRRRRPQESRDREGPRRPPLAPDRRGQPLRHGHGPPAQSARPHRGQGHRRQVPRKNGPGGGRLRRLADLHRRHAHGLADDPAGGRDLPRYDAPGAGQGLPGRRGHGRTRIAASPESPSPPPVSERNGTRSSSPSSAREAPATSSIRPATRSSGRGTCSSSSRRRRAGRTSRR